MPLNNYEQLLRDAEDRSNKVQQVFETYDHAHSGSIDSEELMCLLDDLGVLKGLKTNKIEFLASELERADKDLDSPISFEEFKTFYNAAKEDAMGRRKKGAAKTPSGPDEEAKEAPVNLRLEAARKKAEEAEAIRQQNLEMKRRLAATQALHKAGDKKELDADVIKMRRDAAAKRKLDKLKRQEEAAKARAHAKSVQENDYYEKTAASRRSSAEESVDDDESAALSELAAAARERKALQLKEGS